MVFDLQVFFVYNMYRYFVTLAYNGKNYVGWQIQPNGMSVQEMLQKAFSTILRQSIDVVGAGRTDSGVHARKMYAHFDVEEKIGDCVELTRRLNNFLPKDISVFDISPVVSDAHARFSAISRTYKYYITTSKDPFLYDLKYRIFFYPDIEKMNYMCDIFKLQEDFTSFSKLHTDVKTNICQVYEAYWEQVGEDFVFTIKANRFLRNMVRSIVGTMLEIGRGRLDEDGLLTIFESKNRQVAGDSAPGHALFLCEVEYPDEIWEV